MCILILSQHHYKKFNILSLLRENKKRTKMLETETSAREIDLQNSKRQLKEQQIQNQKDRTLFCVNIDEKCTEDILFELFYQVSSHK